MRKGFVLRLTPKGLDDGFRAAFEALKSQCFPDGTQWFGWCETDIRLPRPLDKEAFDPRWDVARIFSPIAELRAQRRGGSRLVLLLTEDEALVHQLLQGLEGFEVTKHEPDFSAEPSCRLLVGKKPKKPIGTNPNALVEVALPRELDYGISVADGEGLVANVQCYFDAEHRLRFVRYCAVQAKRIGERKVTPLWTNGDKSQSRTG